MTTKNSTNGNHEVVNFLNEEGFENGWYVLEVTEERHVIWQSECFATEQEAIDEMNSL